VQEQLKGYDVTEKHGCNCASTCKPCSCKVLVVGEENMPEIKGGEVLVVDGPQFPKLPAFKPVYVTKARHYKESFTEMVNRLNRTRK